MCQRRFPTLTGGYRHCKLSLQRLEVARRKAPGLLMLFAPLPKTIPCSLHPSCCASLVFCCVMDRFHSVFEVTCRYGNVPSHFPPPRLHTPSPCNQGFYCHRFPPLGLCKFQVAVSIGTTSPSLVLGEMLSQALVMYVSFAKFPFQKINVHNHMYKNKNMHAVARKKSIQTTNYKLML